MDAIHPKARAQLAAQTGVNRRIAPLARTHRQIKQAWRTEVCCDARPRDFSELAGRLLEHRWVIAGSKVCLAGMVGVAGLISIAIVIGALT